MGLFFGRLLAPTEVTQWYTGIVPIAICLLKSQLIQRDGFP